MVLEIWNMTDRTFCHFWLFFALLPPNNPENKNSKSHVTTPENQDFEKWKKMPGDIIILHKGTINDNYMMCGSWDMKCDR